MGKSDPYLKITVPCTELENTSAVDQKSKAGKAPGTLIIRTSTVENSLAPEWNETIQFYGVPVGVQSFTVEAFDKDALTSETLGKVSIPLQKCENKWFELDTSGDILVSVSTSEAQEDRDASSQLSGE